MAKRNKFSKVLHNGRNAYDRYVKLTHFELGRPAWLKMSLRGRSALIQMRMRFNGQNNGQITFSVREMASELNCSKSTASKALEEIIDKGWVIIGRKGSFDWKQGRATTWALTSESLKDSPPSKEYVRWKP